MELVLSYQQMRNWVYPEAYSSFIVVKQVLQIIVYLIIFYAYVFFCIYENKYVCVFRV